MIFQHQMLEDCLNSNEMNCFFLLVLNQHNRQCPSSIALFFHDLAIYSILLFFSYILQLENRLDLAISYRIMKARFDPFRNHIDSYHSLQEQQHNCQKQYHLVFSYFEQLEESLSHCMIWSRPAVIYSFQKVFFCLVYFLN